MAKTKPKTIPTQKDVGSFWQLAIVAGKYGVPPTNIVRASRKKLKGKPFVRNVCMAFDLRLQRKKPDTQLFSMTV